MALEQQGPKVPAYAWVVFALTFGLLISDYMARQVLNAVFPLLKAEWALTRRPARLAVRGRRAHGRAADLSASRCSPTGWGGCKSMTAMAVLWSVATLLCGLAQNYEQMLAGPRARRRRRSCVRQRRHRRHHQRLSEAYARDADRRVHGGRPCSARSWASASAALVAAAHGWRTAFLAIGAGGLLLALAYPLFVRESRLNAGERPEDGRGHARRAFARCSPARSFKCAYVGSGLQLFVAGALPAWLPTYFIRYYDLPLDKAAPLAALFLAIGGAGMVICGMISDGWCARRANGRCCPSATASACALLIALAMALGAGTPS